MNVSSERHGDECRQCRALMDDHLRAERAEPPGDEGCLRPQYVAERAALRVVMLGLAFATMVVAVVVTAATG